MATKTSYTHDEVIELLTALNFSDSGTFSIEETKKEWKNSFEPSKAKWKNWLENIAFKTIEERAAHWWWKVVSKEHRIHLKLINPEKSVTEIYVLSMLK